MFAVQCLMETKTIIIAAVIVAATSAMAIAPLINGYNSAYASSSGTSGSAFNTGNSHIKCTAVASGANCDSLTDNGQHTGLFN